MSTGLIRIAESERFLTRITLKLRAPLFRPTLGLMNEAEREAPACPPSGCRACEIRLFPDKNRSPEKMSILKSSFSFYSG
ncbi:MAG: hypothetical protein RBS55_11460 [Bacteroidales bacterium]|nr:hypothetical protein [Bacteroidales bacterium]